VRPKAASKGKDRILMRLKRLEEGPVRPKAVSKMQLQALVIALGKQLMPRTWRHK